MFGATRHDTGNSFESTGVIRKGSAIDPVRLVADEAVAIGFEVVDLPETDHLRIVPRMRPLVNAAFQVVSRRWPR